MFPKIRRHIAILFYALSVVLLLLHALVPHQQHGGSAMSGWQGWGSLSSFFSHFSTPSEGLHLYRASVQGQKPLSLPKPSHAPDPSRWILLGLQLLQASAALWLARQSAAQWRRLVYASYRALLLPWQQYVRSIRPLRAPPVFC